MLKLFGRLIFFYDGQRASVVLKQNLLKKRDKNSSRLIRRWKDCPKCVDKKHLDVGEYLQKINDSSRFCRYIFALAPFIQIIRAVPAIELRQNGLRLSSSIPGSIPDRQKTHFYLLLHIRNNYFKFSSHSLSVLRAAAAGYH